MTGPPNKNIPKIPNLRRYDWIPMGYIDMNLKFDASQWFLAFVLLFFCLIFYILVICHGIFI